LRVEAGIFTSALFDELKANQALTPVEMKSKLDAQLKKYDQMVTLETISAEMLKESLFQPVKLRISHAGEACNNDSSDSASVSESGADIRTR
jgi:hypothetical protein